MQIRDQLRADAASHVEKHIDMHTILYRHGREIALTYVNMMVSYARLDVQSGHFERTANGMLVSGFCRIEERHFEQPLLVRERKQSFWTSRWIEDISLGKDGGDLLEAFMTSMEELCREQGIRLGALCVLVRNKNGREEQRKLPLQLVLPEYAEAVGFPYQIEF